MNEVKKCSISGVGFTLNTDAYEALERYLESLKQTYRENPDGDEIIADIEARIAELILSTQDTARVVERPLIENIVHQLSSAEEISDRDPDGDLRHETPRIPRRLYRDTENARLGGVCAGIGRYFDIDPVWIRLGIFAPLLFAIFGQASRLIYWISPLMGNLFGIFVVCYVIMWFAVPAARTARQRLEMTGERITAKSIGHATAAAAAAPESVARPIVAETVSVLGKVVLICLKLIAGFIVLGLIVSACALIIGLFAVAIGGEELFAPTGMVDFSIWIPILGIVSVLIPIILLIYVMMCLIASRKPGGKTVLAIFILELLAVGSLTLLAVREGLGHRFERRLLNVERIMAPDDGGEEADDDRIAPATEIEPGQERIRIGGADGAIDISVDRQNGRLRLSAGDSEVAVEADAAQQSATIKIQKRDSTATQQ